MQVEGEKGSRGGGLPWSFFIKGAKILERNGKPSIISQQLAHFTNLQVPGTLDLHEALRGGRHLGHDDLFGRQGGSDIGERLARRKDAFRVRSVTSNRAGNVAISSRTENLMTERRDYQEQGHRRRGVTYCCQVTAICSRGLRRRNGCCTPAKATHHAHAG